MTQVTNFTVKVQAVSFQVLTNVTQSVYSVCTFSSCSRFQVMENTHFLSLTVSQYTIHTGLSTTGPHLSKH
jgi:hypothetical protein